MEKVAVLGAGLMGHGIALTMARAGFAVQVTDPFAAARDSAPGRILESLRVMQVPEAEIDPIRSRIEIVGTLAEAVTDAAMVFEAAPEKPALKQEIFAEVEAQAPQDCILASNTSVIPITTIMEAVKRPERALGTHWWNPPHLIPLVEVIKTKATDPEVAKRMFDILVSVGKTPVYVEKDVPGFIGNRLQMALMREAVNLIERGICDAETVDIVVKSSFGRRMSVLGPMEGMDLIGTDLALDILHSVLGDLDGRPHPSPLLEQMVAEGNLGMKTGTGFRSWTEEEAKAVRKRLGDHLVANS